MYHLAFEKCKINTLLTELCTSEFSQYTAYFVKRERFEKGDEVMHFLAPAYLIFYAS